MNKNKNENLIKIRHSTEHVLQTAMKELYPGIKLVMGPAIDDGFYFDFDLVEKISPDDFPKIEQKMQEIIDSGMSFNMEEISFEKAKELFKSNEYKLDTVNEIELRNEKPSICILGDNMDYDLCMGGHIKNTSEIKAFKLLSVAGAYYKGDENNKMLQRIYGTAFLNKKDLEEYLEIAEYKKENDHRKINQLLDIFATSDLVGKGLVMYTPNGTVIKNELRDHLLKVCKKYGAQEVNIPHMAKIDLYEKSGHAQKFKEELFTVRGHYDNEYVLKPVNCPHHTQIYASRPRSYRDLPISYVESTQQHRDEKPGAMVGLNRAISFEIDDGHTFCTPEQIKEEAVKLILIMKEFYEALGMWGDHWVSLSFRDPKTPEKYIGKEEDWEKAQSIIIEINEEMNLKGTVIEGEAALYGPKIDVMYKDALNNDRQLGTVQLDFAMPSRFELTYTDKDGEEKTPVMLHRAILGSYHRFIAYILESTGGSLPVWLAPEQIEIIPISDNNLVYANKIKNLCLESNLRVKINDRDISMGAKIRDAQLRKVPYMFILGNKEEEKDTVSIRFRDESQKNSIKITEAIERIENIYLTKSLKLW